MRIETVEAIAIDLDAGSIARYRLDL